MKLKQGFVLHTTGGEHMMVATGKATREFNGLVRGNDAANAILEQLQKETTEEKIVEALMKQFEGDRDAIARDVHRIVDQLRTEGFLDE